MFVILLIQTAAAQMSHRVAVLVNENSQASKKAANVFAELHGVPGCNLIYLDLPETLFAGRFECTPEEFKAHIYNPAVEVLLDRDLDSQVLAWVYSVDFPIRIVTADYDRQQMSIMGLTFLHGKVPADLKLVEFGEVLSPLFAGPAEKDPRKNPPRALSISAAGLKEKMPLPSMMLGYIGSKGNLMGTVLGAIEKGAVASQTGAKQRVLFVKTDDEKRSPQREWQFEGVRAEMAVRGGVALITDSQTLMQTNLTGVLVGQETVKPSGFGTFAPGAMAEHLTSFSAEFQKGQSKCTEWLKAGATVTAGVVVEPYNNWAKFPHARFHAHYGAGCTAMESFYQSLGNPLQSLLLGNPLSRVTGVQVQIKPIGLSKEITSDLDAAFVLGAKNSGSVPMVYGALLNGKQIKEREGNSLIELPFKKMSDGYHEVRLIARASIPTLQTLPGGFSDIPVFINKKGRSIQVTGVTDEVLSKITMTAAAKGEETPDSVYLLWNGRELARADHGTELVFDEQVVGEGPHRIQAVAVYADGMEVRSAPAVFSIEFNPADK